MKKPRRDFITGVVGLVGVAFFYFQILDIKKPAKLLEPGPRLMPYAALCLLSRLSSAAGRTGKRAKSPISRRAA